MKNSLYRILEIPLIYSLSQLVFAYGAKKNLLKKINQLLTKLPKSDNILDIGCGPYSWLFDLGIKPTGLDISSSYINIYRKQGAKGILGSSDKLPFKKSSFVGVWSIGLLHHLPDKSARKTLLEALRVCRKGGYIVILDAVLPTNSIARPLAYIIRKMDRGKFIRDFNHNLNLLPNKEKWEIERITYAYTGLEMMVMKYNNRCMNI